MIICNYYKDLWGFTGAECACFFFVKNVFFFGVKSSIGNEGVS